MNTIIKLSIVSLLTLLQSCVSTGPYSENLGKRTIGSAFDDQLIESRGKANIKAALSETKNFHINVTSFNGVVLLTGQIPSQAARDIAVESLEGLRKVRVVHNELEIAGPTTFMSRTNDTWLTTKVKTALLTSDKIAGTRIKVITENSVVYLMGLLRTNEADAAVLVAREVYGVQKIVKVFELIN